MTREELFSALDLAPEPSGPIGLDDEQPTAPAGPPPSPTALDLDAWSLRRGAEALDDPDSPVSRVLLNGAQDEDANRNTAADCLAAAFEPSPQLAENCADETRGRYFRQLFETEQYQALHSETRLDPLASELAAGHFAQGYAALIEQEEAQEPQEGPQGTPGQPQGDPARQELKRDLRALSAASKALSEATQDVDDLRDAQRSLGGDGAGEGGRIDAGTLKARFDRIKNSETLRKIIANAGRYRRLAQAKQRQKTKHGQDDVVGVEMGNDLARLLPAELAALGDEDLELDALRRYLERGLMQRDYRGIEHVAQGPIVVVVDESGSMSDDPIATAKAFALAMAWIARHQRRWICLVGFSDGTEGTFLAMPPGKWDQSALLDWLEHFYSGGTTMDVPLVTLPQKWAELGCPEGKTDVIQITDALVHIPDEMRENFLTWKAATKAKYYTLVLDSDDAGDLRAISDRVWCLPNLSIEQDAIQELMSI
jgi:uncharacterized protein with von Willebrand factor type A (vWA) domain